MRVTVIGANGFVGSAFTRLLSAQPGVELVPVTRANYAALAGKESDVVIEAACNSKKYLADKEPLKEFSESVTHRLQSLIDFPAACQLHISSVDVYSDLTSPESTREDSPIALERVSSYGCHKLLAEQLVQHYAKRWLIIRLAGMVGPGLRKNPVFDILNGQPLHISPDSRYQFLHTDFIAKVVWNLIQSGCSHEIFNVAGNGLVSPREIGELAGKELDLSRVPESTAPRVVDVNIEKISRFAEIPSSRQAVTDFIRKS